MKHIYSVEYRPTTTAKWERVSLWEMHPRLFSMFLEYHEQMVAGQNARHLYRVRRVYEGKADYFFSGFNHRKAA